MGMHETLKMFTLAFNSLRSHQLLMKLKEYKRIFNIIKFGSSFRNCAVGNYIPDEYAPIEWENDFAKIVEPVFNRNLYKTYPVSDYNSPVSISYKTREFKKEKWYHKEYGQPILVYLWKRIS